MARSRKIVDVADSYAVRLMQHLVVPTFVIDPKRRVVIWNRACERLTGVAASEVIGTTRHWQAFYETRRPCLADLVALDRPEQLPEYYSEYAARGHNGLGFSAENWCVMPKLGSQLYLAIDAGPIHDEAGDLIAVVETLRDLTDQKRAETALKELATKDGLTGLSNRRAFDQMLMNEWARAQRTQKPVALLFADVDHFKLFNDRHGHQTGDECLRAVAAVVSRHAVRPLDLASRYGGEEFALILPDMDGEAACTVAEDIRTAVMALAIAHGANGAGDHVTLSVGVASHIPGEADGGPDRLLGAADEALYAAKRLGRNRVIGADRLLAEFAGLRRAGVPVPTPIRRKSA
ncbi:MULTISPECIES: sensor domain-containing diguanylate cyclase [Bradyrhizobium]|uniref:sensor domain-containing diguanylate cyclase n=1 Tax=Bradyrhizobium TaxID=374 RepID=UPI0003F4D11E|nr:MULTISPECIES: diguanylate cyclase [Bradyrhizobium]QOG16260.1 diguanylate cyclase [Bradyrhizobium sp. SEMIA]UFW49486.1 diguanylate cyclase [Bradyrhizobium arachidis]